ncbi:protein yippee-like 4 isoform X2 [Numida meleagris]|uniref:protein yippee-like 4 isoform X2 n=1 Tax=Numida meleagris TaxID=8996 RepID=UPI000B3DA65A|nr:protein yippee-like 4 isoform X2 [Numida meleagris]
MPPAPPRPPGALPPAVPPAHRHRVPTTTRLPPRTFHSYLPRSHRTYSCVHCRAHLARHEELISKVPPLHPCHLPGSLGWPSSPPQRLWEICPLCSVPSMMSLECQVSPCAHTIPSVPTTVSVPPRWHGGDGGGGEGDTGDTGVSHTVSLQSFQGSHGRAYLFNSVVNVGCGPAEQRLLLTGLHSVADIFCESCKTTLGWKYAFESSQKYKEGKFIIEMSHMVKENGWD